MDNFFLYWFYTLTYGYNLGFGVKVYNKNFFHVRVKTDLYKVVKPIKEKYSVKSVSHHLFQKYSAFWSDWPTLACFFQLGDTKNVKLKLVCGEESRWGRIQTDQVLLLQTKMHQQNTNFMRLLLMETIVKKGFCQNLFSLWHERSFLVNSCWRTKKKKPKYIGLWYLKTKWGSHFHRHWFIN